MSWRAGCGSLFAWAWRVSGPRRVLLHESGAFVCHREAAIHADGHLDVVAVVGFAEICQELLRRVVFRAADGRAMQLPEVLEAGSLMNGLPVLG